MVAASISLLSARAISIRANPNHSSTVLYLRSQAASDVIVIGDFSASLSILARNIIFFHSPLGRGHSHLKREVVVASEAWALLFRSAVPVSVRTRSIGRLKTRSTRGRREPAIE